MMAMTGRSLKYLHIACQPGKTGSLRVPENKFYHEADYGELFNPCWPKTTVLNNIP